VLSAGGSGTGDCVCQPGHGTIMGSGPCKICPAGTFAHGGTLEECTPCGEYIVEESGGLAPAGLASSGGKGKGMTFGTMNHAV
jgi:hypothetical protein